VKSKREEVICKMAVLRAWGMKGILTEIGLSRSFAEHLAAVLTRKPPAGFLTEGEVIWLSLPSPAGVTI
jgi:hypothetical protein